MYTNKKLPINEKFNFNIDFKNSENNETSRYSIFIWQEKKTSTIDLRPIRDFYMNRIDRIPEETISAVETILRHSPSLNYIPIRRSFYNSEGEKSTISDGFEVWSGHHQSITIGEKYLYLNIDKAIAVFYPPIPIIEFMPNILKKSDLRNLNNNDLVRLNDNLKGIKVERIIGDKKMYSMINGISNLDSKRASYEDDNFIGSVYEYYEKIHSIKLKYPHLPCAIIGKRAKTYLCPLELLQIQTGQAYTRKLTSFQNTEIIRVSAIQPDIRFRYIKQTFDDLNRMWEPIKQHFGIKISSNFERVKARKIEAPKLAAQNNSRNTQETPSVDVKNGSWSMNKFKFETPEILKNWLLINFCPRVSNLEDFIKKIQNCGLILGLKMGNPAGYYQVNPNNGIENQILKIFQRHQQLQIIIFIVNDDVDQPMIKRFSKDILKIESQCIRDRNVRKIVEKSPFDILTNICLSLNQKIGGTNISLLNKIRPKVLNSPTLIMGADVNHAAPGSTFPSIASVVGSINFKLSSYVVVHRQQAGRVEIIQDLLAITKILLEAFKDKNNKYPQKIIFFRDGVGRGQYAQVKARELSMIEEACNQVSPSIPISITLVVVTKRHNTRFCPVNVKEGVGRCNNIPPGTTIDRTLCHPYDYEFFMCSHLGIQGTTKPSKYSVLLDNNGLTATELQTLIYYLCHTYAYCTKSISIPAPVQYAHNDAYHGREYTMAHIGKAPENSSSRDHYYIR